MPLGVEEKGNGAVTDGAIRRSVGEMRAQRQAAGYDQDHFLCCIRVSRMGYAHVNQTGSMKQTYEIRNVGRKGYQIPSENSTPTSISLASFASFR